MAAFDATIDAWCQKSKRRMVAVFRGSAQAVASKATDRIPIDLGFARASILGSLSRMPTIDPSATNKEGRAYGLESLAEVILTINSAQLGQTIYVGWTAAYALALEYGHSKQAPTGYVGITAQEWGAIVKAEVSKAKAAASVTGGS